MDLYPYQEEGAKWLAEVGRGLLADEMGLGKTAQAIRACDLAGADHVEVVCPASVVTNWIREIERFKTGRWTYKVYSYDRAVKRAKANAETFKIDVLILDEAHYLKTRTAKRTKAIFGEKCDGVGGLVEHARNVFLLTGTPMPNHAAELWPMLRAVMPLTIIKNLQPLTRKVGPEPYPWTEMGVEFKPFSYWGFVQKYCRTRDNGFGIQIIGTRNADDLKARMKPFVLRRKKDAVLADLPPIRFDELALEGKIDLTQDEKDAVSSVQKALTENGVAGLKQLAPHVASLRRVTGLAKVPAAVEWIADWLDAGGKKLVVFAHHREVLAAIARPFAQEAVSVTGSTASDDRQRCVDLFQQDPDVRLFVGQIQAAGTGITLTAASDVLFVESSWVPADNEQAAMRIHRIGQRNACLVRFAMLAGSIDERVQRAVLRKTKDIAALFS